MLSLRRCTSTTVWAVLACASLCTSLAQVDPARGLDFRRRRYASADSVNHVVVFPNQPDPAARGPPPLHVGDKYNFTVTVNKDAFFVEGCLGNAYEEIYVLLEGPAVLSPLNTHNNSGVVTVEYTAYDAGAYNVHVESIQGCNYRDASENITRWRRHMRKVQGSPFALQVTSPNSNVAATNQAPLATYPTSHCTRFPWRHGRWLPDSHGRDDAAAAGGGPGRRPQPVGLPRPARGL